MKVGVNDMNDPIQNYLTWITCFSKNYAAVHHMKQRIADKQRFSKRRLSIALARLCYSKVKLVQAKEVLGYTDHLTFLEDNKFKEFEIRNGSFIGNPKYAYEIVYPWFTDFITNTSNQDNYRFEVANLIIALAENVREP